MWSRPIISPNIDENVYLSEDYLKSVSESELRDRAYTPFELAKHERESIEEIKKLLRLKKYQSKNSIQESLDFIEQLANKMNIAVINEKKEGKTTWELEADMEDLKKVFEQLDNLLKGIEAKEVDDSVAPPKRRR
jgi:thymidylate synthase